MGSRGSLTSPAKEDKKERECRGSTVKEREGPSSSGVKGVCSNYGNNEHSVWGRQSKDGGKSWGTTAAQDRTRTVRWEEKEASLQGPGVT